MRFVIDVKALDVDGNIISYGGKHKDLVKETVKKFFKFTGRSIINDISIEITLDEYKDE